LKLPPIKVVSDAEAEKSDYVVCCKLANDPGCFDDNLVGECAACGAPVIFRPHSPKRPAKICTECFVEMRSRQ
jgi:hypothetical protein